YPCFPLTGFLLLHFSLDLRPPRPTLFPYTTLFRSIKARVRCNGHRAFCFHPLPNGADNLGILGTGILPGLNLNEGFGVGGEAQLDRKSTRLNSSHVKISYAVFCLKKKKKKNERDRK